jgi:ATP-binding cassette subfamily G (WHITE) protein 2 (SNQ2)
LDYAKSLRIMTDIFEMTTFVSIYQAGEGIYDQFDKVLVIDQGRQVYFGPAKEARQYFMDMGYANFPRQTTADYLTGCTDPNERRYASEKYNAENVPSTPEAMAEYFHKSDAARGMREEMEAYKKHLMQENPVEEFREAVLEAKGRGSRKSSPYQVGFFSQVAAIAWRQIKLKCVHIIIASF